MSVQHAPAPITTSTGGDDELSHDWCCDRDRALCGTNIAGVHDCPDDLSCGCQQCVVCEDLIDAPCSPECDYRP